ncbi:MAG TPA: DUF3301 domain-containing protein [Gammaproteobacteria bacterium]|nr:DUF3301 domain-containing protein [Gammaproteobacteria bacterium]
MTLGLVELIALFLVALALLLWWHTVDIERLALGAARHHCGEMGVQFLDDSIILSAMGLQRDRHGRLRVRRVFRFEFASTGEQRYKGYVTFLAYETQGVVLEPYRVDSRG